MLLRVTAAFSQVSGTRHWKKMDHVKRKCERAIVLYDDGVERLLAKRMLLVQVMQV